MTEARDGNPTNGDYEVRVSIGIRLLNQNHFYTELLEKDKKQYKNYWRHSYCQKNCAFSIESAGYKLYLKHNSDFNYVASHSGIEE